MPETSQELTPHPPMELVWEARVEEARRQFNRIIAQWAQDVLVMRRAGRHRLRWESAQIAPPLAA